MRGGDGEQKISDSTNQVHAVGRSRQRCFVEIKSVCAPTCRYLNGVTSCLFCAHRNSRSRANPGRKPSRRATLCTAAPRKNDRLCVEVRWLTTTIAPPGRVTRTHSSNTNSGFATRVIINCDKVQSKTAARNGKRCASALIRPPTNGFGAERTLRCAFFSISQDKSIPTRSMSVLR